MLFLLLFLTDGPGLIQLRCILAGWGGVRVPKLLQQECIEKELIFSSYY